MTSVAQFITGKIRENNLLGLTDEEITGMASEILSSQTDAQVHNWCDTLGLGTDVAEDIIKARRNEGEAPAKAATPAAAAASQGQGRTLHVSSGKKKKGKGNRGTKLDVDKPASKDLKPGLFECGCFATVHSLKANCGNCGRIICEQEADDVCYFCGLDPSRCVEYEISVQDGQLSDAAQKADKDQYEAAIARRDQLLEYARNRSKRTKVIDDQSASLFAPQNAWLSPLERRTAQKSAAEEEQKRQIELLHRKRGTYSIHTDFVKQNLPLGALKRDEGEGEGEGGGGGGTSGSGDDSDSGSESETQKQKRAEPLPTLLRNIWYSPDGSRVDSGGKKKGKDSEQQQMHKAHAVPRFEEVSKRVQQDYFEEDMEVFTAESAAKAHAFDPALLLSTAGLGANSDDDDDDDDGAGNNKGDGSNVKRVSESIRFLSTSPEVAERFRPTQKMLMNDEGICLSMHQPWASLLVAGIKRHEGRTWHTEYRGRLWIHAAAKEPVNVSEVEAQHASFKPPLKEFPEHYPTRVLLGYVYVTACLNREEYEEAFKPEERQEESPFSFICVEPKALAFPLPMSGDHKLFKLENKVLTAAKKQLGEIQ